MRGSPVAYILPTPPDSHHSVLRTRLRSFQIYDADNFATARYFMLRKAEPDVTPSALSASQEAVVTGGSSNTPTGSASQPGDPGRWSLPNDISGLVALNYLLTQLQGMSDTYLTYELLQVRAPPISLPSSLTSSCPPLAVCRLHRPSWTDPRPGLLPTTHGHHSGEQMFRPHSTFYDIVLASFLPYIPLS